MTANVTQAKKAFCIYLQEAFFYTFSHSMVSVGLGIRPKMELFIIFIITAVFAFYRIIIIVLFRINKMINW